ncbi:MAG TPA: hypothetical protein PKB03_03330 [Baekduia sp.]|nr:hypothetical protein [Baekduia sp.]
MTEFQTEPDPPPIDPDPGAPVPTEDPEPVVPDPGVPDVPIDPDLPDEVPEVAPGQSPQPPVEPDPDPPAVS